MTTPTFLLEKNTKNQIIQILLLEWPLTTKQIHNTIKRNFSQSLTYQAVHKAVKELVEEKVLQKIEGKFQVSYEWADNISKFGKNLKRHIEENKTTHPSQPMALIFNSMVEYAKFIINEFYNEAYNPERKDCMCFWNHAYPIIGASKEEYENLKKMFSRETHYNICGGKTFLDKMTSDYLEKLGKKSAINAHVSTKLDTFVNGDYLLQTYFEKELEDKLAALYKKIKNEKQFDLKTLFEFMSNPTKIRAIIFKNAEFADQLREEAKKQYYEKCKKVRR